MTEAPGCQADSCVSLASSRVAGRGRRAGRIGRGARPESRQGEPEVFTQRGSDSALARGWPARTGPGRPGRAEEATWSMSAERAGRWVVHDEQVSGVGRARVASSKVTAMALRHAEGHGVAAAAAPPGPRATSMPTPYLGPVASRRVLRPRPRPSGRPANSPLSLPDLPNLLLEIRRLATSTRSSCSSSSRLRRSPQPWPRRPPRPGIAAGQQLSRGFGRSGLRPAPPPSWPTLRSTDWCRAGRRRPAAPAVEAAGRSASSVSSSGQPPVQLGQWAAGRCG